MLTEFDVAVIDACEESWDGMRGDLKERFCERCQKTVHSLAQMRPAAVELLAMKAAAGVHVCGQVTRRKSGELVMLEDVGPLGKHRGRNAVLSAAMLAGLPAAAQVSVDTAKHEAVLTGQLRHPDGSAVESGLIHLSGAQDTLFVADDRGRFELHVPPGSYEITLITAADQGEQVRVASLHEGLQDLGVVNTQAGQKVLVDEATTTTGGTLASTIRWSWRGRLSHPLLYVRSLLRRRG